MIEEPSQQISPAVITPSTILIVGAGPKAAAVVAKARVLNRLGIGKIKLIVIERHKQVAANWRGQAGFTDGESELGTPPEKDVGFPYHSIYGTSVDLEMLKYSWHAYKITLAQTAYSDWIDRGRYQPKHGEWAHYLDWVLFGVAEDRSEQLVELRKETEVKRVELDEGRLKVHVQKRKTDESLIVDGVMFTGPGESKMFENAVIQAGGNRVFDGRNYWENVALFREMPAGKVAIIGAGETAASIALSLLGLPNGPVRIDIINRHGPAFTRGESFRENKMFSNAQGWKSFTVPARQEFISRTDRGVFSVAAQKKLDNAEKVDTISGKVVGIEETAGAVVVRLQQGNPPEEVDVEYDRIIVALGFDPWSNLKILDASLLPPKLFDSDPGERDAARRTLELGVDENLRLPLTVPEVNVHMPMLAGLSQSPGFPNLSCLGHLSDRVLSKYIAPPQSQTEMGELHSNDNAPNQTPAA